MKLIADSGSTKTDWVLIDGGNAVGRYATAGINPFHQTEDVILDILRRELLSQLATICGPVDEVLNSSQAGQWEIFFYGSGVRPELVGEVQRMLGHVFPGAAAEVNGDLLAAARAVCGRRAGIACILGTGANSGLYDGSAIVANTPPLGYILGDEGSGAVLGRNFLNALYKGFINKTLLTEFEHEMHLSMALVIDRVYRQPQANKFLASLVPFIARHIDSEEVSNLVTDNFCSFFRHNVVQYGRSDLPVCFVGSVAYHFEKQLRQAARGEGFDVGSIIKSPIDGLIDYHLQHQE